MPESVENKTVFSLLEVLKSIQKTVNDRYKSSFWVKAEMNKLNYYSKSGHCYPDLVEKQQGRILAQMRATLWSTDYSQINQNFLKVLNEPLKDGIKILFLARISFDTTHGLSLQILDIDPSYTFGDLEKEKQETISKLINEGMFNQNRSVVFPMLPQRIAIISVESSKGYKDFKGKIDDNHWHYQFFHMLFPSVLQGEKIIESIAAQLRRINKVKHHFDVVAIIRGGGGDLGLSSYNDYQLAKEITLFPIPVLTGIGHITNETVVEMVSYKNLITPTDLADFLLQKFHNFSVPLLNAQTKIIERSQRILLDEKQWLKSEVKLFRSVTGNILTHNRNNLKENVRWLFQQSHFIFRDHKNNLLLTKEKIMKGVSTLSTAEKLQIEGIQSTTIKSTARLLSSNHQALNHFGKLAALTSQTLIYANRNKTLHAAQKISERCPQFLITHRSELSNIERNINNMSPREVMRRGYSITLINGKSIKSPDAVKPGDTMNTQLFEGTIISTVKSTNKTEQQ